MLLQSDRDYGSIEIPTKLSSENKQSFVKSIGRKVEEETSDKGSSAGSSLETEDEDQRIKQDQRIKKDQQNIHSKTSENEKNQKNSSDQLDLSPENSPSKTNLSQTGTGSKIPVKRSPQKKQRAPQPPKQQHQQQPQQQQEPQQQQQQPEVKNKTENESKNESDKSTKITSKIPLKKSDSGGLSKSPKEKTTSFPSNNNNNNGVRKALFTSSNSQLNVATSEASRSPKVSTTEIKQQVRKSSSTTISSTIHFNQHHQPLMESVPITVNSHIPSSGPNHALAVAAAKKASTSETGTQMDQPEKKQNPENDAKPEKKSAGTGSQSVLHGDDGKVEDQAKVGNKPDKTVDGHVLHGSGKKWSYTDGKNSTQRIILHS